MSPPRTSHRVLCVGAAGASDLGFQENNAKDVFRLLTGALGPPSIRAACLVGENATKKAITGALEVAAKEPDPFYVVYYSGSATSDGIRVADGFVDAAALGRHFTSVSAPSVLFVLDVVVGPSSDEDVAPAWARALAQTRPGLRLAAARGTRIGAGAEGQGHGRFTAALLAALDSAEGDIDFAGARFISDKRALEEAKRGLEKRWGATHLPLEFGPFGGFPLARCQAEALLGSAQILGIAVGKSVSGTIRYAIDGRKGLPTILHYALLDATDELIAEGQTTLIPEADHETGKARFALAAADLADHLVWGAMLEVGETVHVRYRITLRDTRNRVLHQKPTPKRTATRTP